MSVTPPMPSSASSCDPKRKNLDVGLRLGGADDLGVELVELAEAALLRPLVAEGGAMGRDLQAARYCCQPSLR